MAASPSRGHGRGTTYTKQAAQERFLEALRSGHTINGALEKIGRGRSTYEAWRRHTRQEPNGFAALADQAMALRNRRDDAIRGERLGFEEFRRKYLKSQTYWHQLQWVDLLEGREPRDLHPAQEYVRGKRNKILANCPPFHAKSTTLTVDYSVYRLCMDPSFRILVISAGKQLAEDFLYGVKQRLTSPEYIELQKAYAPDGGWEATSEAWSATRIVFGTDVRSQGSMGTSAEKDPNFQAVGMRSKIYGKRADLIIVDDGVDGTNVNEYEKQRKWLGREVQSRLEAGGKIIVIGTRISAVDLYSELMNPENYGNAKPPWTYLASPAILEEAEDPKDHVTLWPYADQPWIRGADDLDECLCEGLDLECAKGKPGPNGSTLYPRWNGIHLEMGPRGDNDPQQWALVYQQTSVDENSTFPAHAVTKATNGHRRPGLLRKETFGHPLTGMHNKYVIASCDPAIKGFAAILVMAVDPATEQRYVLNCWNMKGPTPAELKDKMKAVTEEYHVNEWRVEKTGLLQFFTQDEGLRVYMATRGVLFREHNTNKSTKWDAGFGVASMGPLFGIWEKATETHGREVDDYRELSPRMIELPGPRAEDAIKALIHQLVIWSPQLDPARTPCDLVMALWFADIAARQYLRGNKGSGGGIRPFRRAERFLSRRSRNQRAVVKVAELRAGMDG